MALRNRVMHQEAIFEGVAAINRPSLSVDTLHAQLLETIGWIDPDAAKLATCLDRFSVVHGNMGRSNLEATIKTAFSIW